MVGYCSAYNCTNKAQKGCGVSFHRFPHGDTELLKKWVAAVKRKNFTPTKTSRLCSKHFSEDCYQIRPNASYPLLKPDAVPNVFDFPAHLSTAPPKKRRTIIKHVTETPYKSLSTNQCEKEIQHITPDNIPIPSTSSILDSPGSPSPNTEQTECNTSSVIATPTKKRLRREVKILKQRLKRREQKIKSMKDLISTLQKKLNAPENLISILQNNFSGFPLQLMLNNVQNKGKSKSKFKYNDQMKEFALTLYFYSPKSYKYLRSLNFTLPNPSTLRKWVSKFNCSPGFLQEVFLYLKNNVHKLSYLKDVSLTFDAMSIRKQIIYNNNLGKNVGYVDLGGLKTDNHEELATEALVFQIVSLTGHFKCVVGYFFINKLSAVTLSQLVKMCVYKLNEVGVNVHNVTFDGASTNVSALVKLGCQFPEKPYFNLNGIDRSICVFLDPPHMLKLSRNTIADMKLIESPNGVIDYTFIVKLNELQKEQGLKLANKLSDKHVNFKNRKMNVRLAAQTLSGGVAHALEYLHFKGHPDFTSDNCLATVEYIRTLDNLFDYFNSRDPFGRGFKGPVKMENVERDEKMLQSSEKYLHSLKIDSINVLKHPRKTFALGFLTNINSLRILRERLLSSNNLKYLLTYKCSQDHLELFFSCIRSRSGNNNNPNVQQFSWALRKLMFRNSVRPSEVGNCLEFNPDQHFVVDFNVSSNVELNYTNEEEDDFLPMATLFSSNELSYYKDNILYYISGFVVRKIFLKINCQDCLSVLITGEENLSAYTHFTDFVTKGKLIRANDDVFRIVKFVYSVLVYQYSSENNCNTKKAILDTCFHFRGTVFKGHISNGSFEETHELKLIKLIASIFCKVYCHHIAKEKPLR